ncbi:ATP-binding protein [Streptomyces sp. NBC_01643]|uniref:AlbA family DNA-binding domain-containing protein n=1 Tax=Streptomyces sp. NBC_01643 TaxID=2975906 RepID=UPI002F909D34|nr:ATP-binding protein [Streptomyces sp. NBC_01643]
MVALRSRRLERLFAARLDSVPYAQVAALVDNQVTEHYDLDFKRGLYGSKDAEKRNLAGDVAAMANTAGGVIVLGVDEDDQARACAVPGVALSDDEVGRIRQIVSSLVSPLPTFDVLPIASFEQDDHGFLLIAVPRSPSAPHAVLVNNALRFPRRNGTTTTYLSEPEVATAYRNRFTGMQSRLDEAARYEADLVQRLDTSTTAFAVVTLVPDVAGGFTLDTKALKEFKDEVLHKDAFGTPLGHTVWYRASVGSGRLVADDRISGKGLATRLSCELYESGAGSFAAIVANREAMAPSTESASVSEVDDEYVFNALWGGLRFLAHHARDRAAAGGNATVRASIWPVTPELRARLVQGRAFREQLGDQQADHPPYAGAVFDIDDLAEDGGPLIAATAVLANGIVQHFGQPEVLRATTDGAIRIRYWHRDMQQRVRAAAQGAEVEVTEETVN